MPPTPSPLVIEAQRLDGGVIVTFDDGRCAVYSAILLYATLPQAQEVLECDWKEDYLTLSKPMR
ncbi:hypothetical protein ACPOL_6867 (plasmid) [Acidisarcina polymorpha]|uniref:Uncharacterized protein n=1 Tax=Acidisarcina polymorpha TaxID=2211140 RepID=A0A2Z5GBU5_9BACT|nr:hypothetical protein ACPOL_6867 [Acidisarcina polymorpha]